MMLLSDSKERNEHVQGLTNGDLEEETLFCMELLDLLQDAIKHNEEKQMGFGQVWVITEAISYYSCLVFEMNQRLSAEIDKNKKHKRS